MMSKDSGSLTWVRIPDCGTFPYLYYSSQSTDGGRADGAFSLDSIYCLSIYFVPSSVSLPVPLPLLVLCPFPECPSPSPV